MRRRDWLRSTTDSGRVALAVRCVLAAIALCAAPLCALAQKDSRDEDFAKVDPYTKGERAGLDALGYHSLGPFLFSAGIKTGDLEESAGGIDVLWVETAHFKIGSTLGTYERTSDKREKKKLDGELAQLESRLGRIPPQKGKLDPWLRLHFYAARVERIYADFTTRFALTDEDFGEHQGALAEGPYLGCASKFTLFLAEKRSTLSRVAQRVARRPCEATVRERLTGDSFFMGTSAELVRELGHDLESALHAQVAADVVLNLVDGFRGNGILAPAWFKYGLSHDVARRVDERCAPYAFPAQRQDPDAWRWEPRVYGLVVNGFVKSFARMDDWTRHEDMDSGAHLVAWSRVAWLATFEAPQQRELLLALTKPMHKTPPAERDARARERQSPALEAAFGLDVPALDEQWKRHVLKSYARK